jgi:hypothetical protein
VRRRCALRAFRRSGVPNKNTVATVTDIGLTRKQVQEARAVRDAEKAKPGIIRKIMDAKLQANEERNGMNQYSKGDDSSLVMPRSESLGAVSLGGRTIRPPGPSPCERVRL